MMNDNLTCLCCQVSGIYGKIVKNRHKALQMQALRAGRNVLPIKCPICHQHKGFKKFAEHLARHGATEEDLMAHQKKLEGACTATTAAWWEREHREFQRKSEDVRAALMRDSNKFRTPQNREPVLDRLVLADKKALEDLMGRVGNIHGAGRKEVLPAGEKLVVRRTSLWKRDATKRKKQPKSSRARGLKRKRQVDRAATNIERTRKRKNLELRAVKGTAHRRCSLEQLPFLDALSSR